MENDWSLDYKHVQLLLQDNNVDDDETTEFLPSWVHGECDVADDLSIQKHNNDDESTSSPPNTEEEQVLPSFENNGQQEQVGEIAHLHKKQLQSLINKNRRSSPDVTALRLELASALQNVSEVEKPRIKNMYKARIKRLQDKHNNIEKDKIIRILKITLAKFLPVNEVEKLLVAPRS